MLRSGGSGAREKCTTNIKSSTADGEGVEESSHAIFVYARARGVAHYCNVG